MILCNLARSLYCILCYILGNRKAGRLLYFFDHFKGGSSFSLLSFCAAFVTCLNGMNVHISTTFLVLLEWIGRDGKECNVFQRTMPRDGLMGK